MSNVRDAGASLCSSSCLFVFIHPKRFRNYRPFTSLRADGQCEGDVGFLQVCPDDGVELFPVLIEVHDALWFLQQPELVKLVGQET